MEAVPLIGDLLGERLNNDLGATPRCSNWKGPAKVGYQNIITIESSMTTEIRILFFLSIFTHMLNLF